MLTNTRIGLYVWLSHAWYDNKSSTYDGDLTSSCIFLMQQTSWSDLMCLNSSLSFFISKPPKMTIYFSSQSSVCSPCVYVQHKDVTCCWTYEKIFQSKKLLHSKKILHASSVYIPFSHGGYIHPMHGIFSPFNCAWEDLFYTTFYTLLNLSL